MRKPMQVIYAVGTALLLLGGACPAQGHEDVFIDWTEIGRSIAKTLIEKGRLTGPKVVAVVPLEAERKGVYYLGDLLARRIEAGLVGLPDVKVVTRRELNKLMQEEDLGFTGLVEKRQNVMPRLQADLLVIGRTTPTGKSVQVDCQLMDLAGNVAATASIRGGLPMTDEVRGLLRWQQLPEGAGDGAQVAELCLDYSFEAQRAGSDGRLRWAQMADDIVMRTGEKFWLRVRPQSDCYVYLLLFDSEGKAEVLLPHPKIWQGNRLRGGVLYTFPSPAIGYQLVPPKGLEQLWLVTSYEPLTELKDLIYQLNAGGDAQAVSRHIQRQIQQVATRGMGGASGQSLLTGYKVAGAPPVLLRGVIAGEGGGGQDSPPALLPCNGVTAALAHLRIRHE